MPTLPPVVPKYSINTYTGDGVRTSWDVNFIGGYIDKAHVKLTVTSALDVATHPTFTWTGPNTINVTPAIEAGATVKIYRSTPKVLPLVDFVGGSAVTDINLDRNAKQAIFISQEIIDGATIGNTVVDGGGDGGDDGGDGGGSTIVEYREVYLDDCYLDESSTDSDALEYFFANDGTFGDCKLKWRCGKGRGPSGVYVIDRLIEYTGGTRIIMDFGWSIIRFTTTNAQIRYSPGQQSSANYRFNYFGIECGHIQTAAPNVEPFMWNFPFRDSLVLGTGYAEKMRFHSQLRADTFQTFKSCMLLRNTWSMPIRDCQATNNVVAGTMFIRQDGLCVVTVLDHCEITGFGKAIEPGLCPMTGVNGSFSSGSYARSKVLRQGATHGVFGRNDGAYGYTYSLYDVFGTFVPGTADVLDLGGNVVGVMTISSTGTYTQVSEAYQFMGGGTYVGVDYLMDFDVPPETGGLKVIDVTITDTHVAYKQGVIRAKGIALLSVGSGGSFMALAGGKIAFDLDGGDGIVLNGTNCTTNGNGGTFAKLRNILGGTINNNSLAFFTDTIDIDNTVKDFRVIGNGGYSPGRIINTSKRYTAFNTRGNVFRSNGELGEGVDTDDGRTIPFTPTVTPSVGTTTSQTIQRWFYTINNGVMTISGQIIVNSRGSSAGVMKIEAPKLPSCLGPINIATDETTMAMLFCIQNGSIPLNAIYDPATNTFNLVGYHGESAYMALGSNTNGNYVFSGSFPVNFD